MTVVNQKKMIYENLREKKKSVTSTRMQGASNVRKVEDARNQAGSVDNYRDTTVNWDHLDCPSVQFIILTMFCFRKEKKELSCHYNLNELLHRPLHRMQCYSCQKKWMAQSKSKNRRCYNLSCIYPTDIV